MNNIKTIRVQVIFLTILIIVIFILSLLSFSLAWATKHYGNIGFDEIVFHLRMPLQGTSAQFVQSFIDTALKPALLTAIELSAGILLIRGTFLTFPKTKILWIKSRKKLGAGCLLAVIIWTIVLLINAQVHMGFFNYIWNSIITSSFIEEEYVDPGKVEITFPKNKKNLIFIFVESAETSAQDELSGGLLSDNCIPEMTQIAENNISFSQSEKIQGAAVAPECGWTIAGMVSENAGLPLKLFEDGRNSMSDYDSFMPGVKTLGDILKNQGYKNVFMAGSDFVFGGRKLFYKSHGDYEILDYYTAIEQGVISKNYYEWWGFEDKILYDWAKERLLEMAEKEEPFNFSMLTSDTHHEDGYVCSLCRREYNDQYSNVWRCASRQLADFIQWLKEQEFYDDTVIVIAGDHCSMDKDFYESYSYSVANGETERKVYNVFINSQTEPIQEKNRQFTTLDLFPSTLAAMGCKIEGEHLGLGVNLFSGEKTLAEQYGYTKMFTEMKKRSPFYDKMIMSGVGE